MVITDFQIFNQSLSVIPSEGAGEGDGTNEESADKSSASEVEIPRSALPTVQRTARNDNSIIRIEDKEGRIKYYLPQTINYTKEITISYKESVIYAEIFIGKHRKTENGSLQQQTAQGTEYRAHL